MTDQEAVEYFAKLAKPRFVQLLRLNVPHLHDPRPGDVDPTGSLKLARSVQPYGDIQRFVAEDKAIGFVVNPGLVPLVKAISFDVRGRKLLVTRTIAPRETDRGVVAHLDGFGVRIMMYFDEDEGETHIVWECLYGVS
jgi:hypothetical protein